MKYSALFDFIKQSGKNKISLSFDETEKIAGIPLDHSFLRYKKELIGYKIKISMKEKTVTFQKEEQNDIA